MLVLPFITHVTLHALSEISERLYLNMQNGDNNPALPTLQLMIIERELNG